MLIVLILLLTVISLALRLASMSVNSTRKMANRLDRINSKKNAKKEKTEDSKKKEKIKNFAKSAANYTAIKASNGLMLLSSICSILRSLLLCISPIVLIVEFLITFIILGIASSFNSLLGG